MNENLELELEIERAETEGLPPVKEEKPYSIYLDA